MVLIRKLHRDLENYIRTIPYASNSILALISNVNNLSKMTDIIAPHLPINNQRMQEYLNNFNPVSRAGMILEDIYNEMEMYQIEKNLELKVRKEIDNNQKEYLLREKIKVIKEELGDISFKEDEIDKLRERIKLNAPSKILKLNRIKTL